MAIRPPGYMGPGRWCNPSEYVRISSTVNPVTNQQMVNIQMLSYDWKFITLYHGPFPPTDADVLAHWNTLVAKALGAEDEK